MDQCLYSVDSFILLKQRGMVIRSIECHYCRQQSLNNIKVFIHKFRYVRLCAHIISMICASCCVVLTVNICCFGTMTLIVNLEAKGSIYTLKTVTNLTLLPPSWLFINTSDLVERSEGTTADKVRNNFIGDALNISFGWFGCREFLSFDHTIYMYRNASVRVWWFPLV